MGLEANDRLKRVAPFLAEIPQPGIWRWHAVGPGSSWWRMAAKKAGAGKL
jgi:hypothetical protein